MLVFVFASALGSRGAWAAEPLLDTDSDLLLQAAEDAAWGEANWFEVPGMSLDLRTGHAQSELGSETYVMAALNLPLERLGAISLRSPTSAAIERRQARTSAPVREWRVVGQGTRTVPESDAARDPAAPASAAQEPVAPRASAPPAEEGAAEALARARRESAQARREPSGPSTPSRPAELELPGELVDEALLRAEHSAGVAGIEERIGSLARRARTSGLVPELRVRGMHGIDQTTSLDSTGAYPGDSTVRDGLDALVEVRLTFELDRLVFGSEEPGLVKQLADAQKQREQLEETVTDLLLDWFEAHERLTRPPARQAEPSVDEEPGEGDSSDDGLDADQRARQREKDKIAVRRSEVHLRRLTGGWFQGAATLAQFTR